jgi:hypothetical protein
MIKSKAIDIFKSFNSKELRQFGDFVKSPFFNKNERLVKLYEILKKEYPAFKSESFTKENVFEQLYPGKKYKDNEIRRNFSYLLELCEKFLLQLNIADPFLFETTKTVLNELGSRNIGKLFNIKLNRIDEQYKEYADIDEGYFKQKYEIESIKSNFSEENLLNNRLRLFKYQMAHYLISILKLHQDFKVIRIMENYDYEKTLFNKFFERFDLAGFLADIKPEDETLYKILSIYYFRYMISLGHDKNDTYYHELKRYVYDNLGKFSRREKYNVMLFLSNSASEKLSSGRDFILEVHEINEKIIKEGLLKFDDELYIDLNKYRVILEIALKLKKTDWALKFIEEHLTKLSPQKIDNIKNYSYSILSFAKGNFHHSLELVSKINKYYNYHFEFISRAVKLKCLYELKYIEDIFYSLDSYRHSLNNNDTLPELSKTQFRNFMNYFERCIKFKLQDIISDVDVDLLKDEIMKVERILEKDWLIEKLEELKK